MLKEVLKNVQHLGMPDGGDLEVFSRRRRAGQHKDAGANDGPDPQRGERPRPQRLCQPVVRMLRVRDQLVNGLLGKKLAGQKRLLDMLLCVFNVKT